MTEGLDAVVANACLLKYQFLKVTQAFHVSESGIREAGASKAEVSEPAKPGHLGQATI